MIGSLGMKNLYIGLFGVLLLLAGCVDNGGGATNATSSTEPFQLDQATQQELTQLVKDLVYVQSRGQLNNPQVTLQDYKEIAPGVILLNFSIDGSSVPLYITKDKQYVIFGMEKIATVKTQLAQAKQQLNNQPTGNLETTSFPEPYTVTGANMGSDNASIIMVEFSDFQCPFCGRFFRQSIPYIKEEWVNAGRLKFYYKHLPLTSIHPQAEPAARASYCADKQGKFWEYHDWIFENINTINSDQDYFNAAEQLGLNVSQFQECFNSDEARTVVQNDLREATQTFGLTGTPSFLIIVPKDKVSKDEVQQSIKSLNQILRGGVRVIETPSQYIIVFSGAVPYTFVNSTLSSLEQALG